MVLVYAVALSFVLLPYGAYQLYTGFRFFPLFDPHIVENPTVDKIVSIRTQMIRNWEWYQPFFYPHNLRHPLSKRVFDRDQETPLRREPESYMCRDCNVVFILVDTLRADHMGFNGYPRNTTPNLDMLASKSVNFANALSQDSITTTSVASIFTSDYPKFHGMIEVPYPTRLSDRYMTLAEVLKDSGYETAAIVLNPFMHEEKNLGQGFDLYYVNSRGFEGDTKMQKYETASKIQTRVLDWLNGKKHERFFLYLHYMDAHYPFLAPSPYNRLFCDDLGGFLPSVKEFQKNQVCKYDQEIAYADDRVSWLIQNISSRYNNTLFVFTADHGEEFFEHGGRFHVFTDYDEELKVPLLFYSPGKDMGEVIKHPVELVDVAPSILYLVGVPAPNEYKGYNFFSRNYTKTATYAGGRYDRDALTMGDLKYLRYKVNSQNQEYLMVEQKDILDFPYEEEMYNLSADPFEQENIIDEQEEEAKRFEQALERYQGSKNETRQEIEPPQQVKDQLRALGYIT